MTFKKWILIAVIAAVVTGFVSAGGTEVLTLDNLKANQQAIGQWIDQNLGLAVLGFVAVYVVVTALSLPGAAIMTLAGGAFFGNLYGLAAVSVASTIGASLAFLVARFLMRDTLRKRYSQTVAKMDRGIEKDGAFYLATLRLVPVFPFFLINLAMGLTAMKLRTYALVSWVAMLPGTFVYVNAGTQLGQIESTGDIVSADLLLSFALLGLFPLIAKFVVGFLRRRKVYAGWQKPAHFDYNLLVIGGGSAGLVSAYIAAAVKAKVALIEKGKMGGDCLNYGCVPSKALLAACSMRASASESFVANCKRTTAPCNGPTRTPDTSRLRTSRRSRARNRRARQKRVISRIAPPWGGACSHSSEKMVPRIWSPVVGSSRAEARCSPSASAITM